MLSDEVFETMKNYVGRPSAVCSDPPNYSILFHPHYVNMFQYQHPVLA